MNTDPTRPPEGADDLVAIGAALRPVEERLRRGLADDAAAIVPSDRLGVILTEARTSPARAGGTGPGGSTGPGGRPHRWLVPVAAAAAAVLVAGGVWAATRGGSPTPPVAGQPTTAVASTSAPSASSSPSATQPSTVPTQTAQGPSSQPVPPATTSASVPVYYVGPLVTGGSSGASDLRLFREFVRTSVTTPARPEGRALAALKLAMGNVPSSSAYVSPWVGVSPVSVTLDGSGRIVVTLSDGLPSGAAASADLAVQQLVWTAQAGMGQGTKPVVLVVKGGGDVAPGMPSGQAHQRPGDAMGVYDVLSPLWVDEPARGATVPAGQRLTVKGVASTFEANVEWQLLRGGSVVASGNTTASVGAPERGAYTFRTKALPAGDYVVRVLESSPKDGSPDAEQLIPFTVR
ncbi:Gmad2 immunoglobulin-like domain-containing protein [Intrasporangium sp. YIM S08009]|uniref:Gmad2 immunoglobulin-like domain-containing protein n=1 Tax=Intrasporangium zincisolvens TaxID=3080018 RepID=UPI002B05805E|nr:Gmad2 immunoglobulin-like domain-containing protein [Intrasporangium sp. YIM S08009]